jgi:hypothetical protein
MITPYPGAYAAIGRAVTPRGVLSRRRGRWTMSSMNCPMVACDAGGG